MIIDDNKKTIADDIMVLLLKNIPEEVYGVQFTSTVIEILTSCLCQIIELGYCAYCRQPALELVNKLLKENLNDH